MFISSPGSTPTSRHPPTPCPDLQSVQSHEKWLWGQGQRLWGPPPASLGPNSLPPSLFPTPGSLLTWTEVLSLLSAFQVRVTVRVWRDLGWGGWEAAHEHLQTRADEAQRSGPLCQQSGQGSCPVLWLQTTPLRGGITCSPFPVPSNPRAPPASSHLVCTCSPHGPGCPSLGCSAAAESEEEGRCASRGPFRLFIS